MYLWMGAGGAGWGVMGVQGRKGCPGSGSACTSPAVLPTCRLAAQPSPEELHRCQQKRQAAVTHSFHTLWSHSFCLLSLSAGMAVCTCQDAPSELPHPVEGKLPISRPNALAPIAPICKSSTHPRCAS